MVPRPFTFGPMGCRTGFYLLLAGDYESSDIVNLMIEMYEFIRDFEGEVPGASPKDCGNYLDMNLPMAKYLARKYLDEVLYDISQERLVYPDKFNFTQQKTQRQNTVSGFSYFLLVKSYSQAFTFS